MVDMDQTEATDLMEASSDLLQVIKSEDGLILRKNTRDSWVTIDLPCSCDQEHSPFPSLLQSMGCPQYQPVPGEWHDPIECNRQLAIASYQFSNANYRGTFGYTPVAQPASLPVAEAAAASPTGEVLYSSQFEHPASTNPMPTLIVSPDEYTALPRDSFTDTVNPDPPYTVSAEDPASLTRDDLILPATTPSETPYNMVPHVALALPTDQLPTNTEPPTADMAEEYYTSPLMRWWMETNQSGSLDDWM
ncbi:hypothetical protein E0Z10_g3095 [Xylaria hypoxylon]|uniref:Uncharacterized protein n=1 Tax=Xylaria hypoxylon TaxID=37992 RepID=A0A4Z0Z2A5_9PEZI|nr:hypothetical protein E0Z10_g3095 [Xylaria hypoxylon]